MKVLKGGMVDEAVIFLRKLLFDYGCVGPESSFWISPQARQAGVGGPDDIGAREVWSNNKEFDYYVQNAVIYFQQTHESPIDGKPLIPDGIVGKHTWSALEAGVKGRDKLVGLEVPLAEIKSVYQGDRIIQTWNKYVGVVEIPKGSNRSPIIDKFTGYVGKPSKIKGPAWCNASASYVENEALGYYPLKYLWRCYDTMQYAKKIGVWIPVEDIRNGKRNLRVGVRFIMQYGGGKGHTGHVAYVEKDKKGGVIGFYTREGNYNDSVGIAFRDINQPTLSGFCDFLPEDDKSVGQKGRKMSFAIGEKTT